MADSPEATFVNPMINLYSRNVAGLAAFYEGLGFRETFRTPGTGLRGHVELALGNFKMGIAAVDAAVSYHGLTPVLGGHSVEIVLWTDDTDRDHARMMTEGAPTLSPPHDFLEGRLRAAWVADPDGNPIQIVQRRR